MKKKNKSNVIGIRGGYPVTKESELSFKEIENLQKVKNQNERDLIVKIGIVGIASYCLGFLIGRGY